jgi:hypothetical protein
VPTFGTLTEISKNREEIAGKELVRHHMVRM